MVDVNDDNGSSRKNDGDNEFIDKLDLDEGDLSEQLDEDGYLPLDEPNVANDEIPVDNSDGQSLFVEDDGKLNNPLYPPWLDVGTSRNNFASPDDRNNNNSTTVHPMTFLHNEVVSFVHLIEPLPSEIEQRDLLVCRIRETVQKHFPDGTRVEVFGSQATGLFLPSSDIDLVVMSAISSKDTVVPTPEGEKKSRNQKRREKRKRGEELAKKNDVKVEESTDDNDDDRDEDHEEDYAFETASSLRCFAQAIRKDWGVDELSYLEIIENTRIPLVKFTHASTNISVDVSFDQPSGPPAAILMKRYLEALPPLRPLTFVLKYFLAARCLNEPYTGGVGSFLLQLMIVAFLQHRERDALNFQRQGVYNLGSLLLEFLELYGIEFNYYTTGISVRYDGFFFPKGSADRRSTFLKPERMSMMAMENPLEPTLDVGQSSFRYQTVQRSFAVAYKMLLAYITARPNEEELLSIPSILVTILPPTEYMTNRKVLKRRDQPLSSRRPAESMPSSNKRSKY